MRTRVGTLVLELTLLVSNLGYLSCDASSKSCPLPLMEVET